MIFYSFIAAEHIHQTKSSYIKKTQAILGSFSLRQKAQTASTNSLSRLCLHAEWLFWLSVPFCLVLPFAAALVVFFFVSIFTCASPCALLRNTRTTSYSFSHCRFLLMLHKCCKCFASVRNVGTHKHQRCPIVQTHGQDGGECYGGEVLWTSTHTVWWVIN